jgi:hypothetical protein
MRHLSVDAAAFVFQVIGDRSAQSGMRDPVGGESRLRQIAALDLVTALRTGLDALQPISIARRWRGVAKLEMRERPVAATTPVAP